MNVARNLTLIFSLILFLFISSTVFSQINYSLKAEAGYIRYGNNTIQVDPGPGWKGYNLNGQNGIEICAVNGVKYHNKLYAGVGVGYLNFDGIHGFSVFPELEYVPLKTRFSPLINIRVGYSHLWNQYEGGTGTTLGEFDFGVNYRISEEMDVCIKFGLLYTQQSRLIPLIVGFRF